MVGMYHYILGGVVGDDVKNVSYSANNNFVTYTLSANKNYSIIFQVCTGAGTVNNYISHTKSICKMIIVFNYSLNTCSNSYL